MYSNCRIWKETIGAPMLKYLPGTIETFSSSSRKTVSSLIQSVKGDKTQINNLVQNLRNFDFAANYSPALALRYSNMNLEAVVDFFRDSSLRVNQFYSATSSLSSVINSLVYIFSSEIEKIEKDIKYLQNYIDNYEFISGENDLFNFNYVENFDNNLNSHFFDNPNIPLVDRNNVDFLQNGNYYIDSSLSKFGISNGSSFINIIENVQQIKQIDNYSEYTTTNSEFQSCINEDIKDSWTVTAKSPIVLSSHIKDLSQFVSYDYSNIRGAETAIIIEFINPIEMDFIRIHPNESNGLQLLQVVLTRTNSDFSVNTTSPVEEYINFSVLNAPLLVSNSVDVVFSKSKVSKVMFIFTQSKYIRSENTASVQETNSKVFHDLIKSNRENNLTSNSKLQDLVYYYFKRSRDPRFSRKNRKNYTEIYSQRYPANFKESQKSYQSLIKAFSDSEMNQALEMLVKENNNIISNIVHSIVEHSLQSRSKIFNSSVFKSQLTGTNTTSSNNYRGDGIVPIKNEDSNFERHLSKLDPIAPGISLSNIINYINSRDKSNYYEYSFSIKNISFGVNNNLTQNKACFISKKIETDGAPIAIKAIVNKVQQRPNLQYSNLDLREPGSFELSICYKENISSEEDWIPVPAFVGRQVESEVLFFNPANDAFLRFVPNPASIRVYKNGVLENPNNWAYIEVQNKIAYSAIFDPHAVYAVSYLLADGVLTQNTIDIDALKDSKFTVKSFSRDGNNGELFNGSGPGDKVTLSYVPYIEDRFTNPVYDSQFGTISTGDSAGYSPIIVTLADGTVARNLTNYLTNNFEKPQFYNTNEYLYIQSGKEIIFNKKINQLINVNYTYIPSSLRFRLIIRNNIPNQYNGIAIDNVIIKSKVKNLDTLSSRLMRLR